MIITFVRNDLTKLLQQNAHTSMNYGHSNECSADELIVMLSAYKIPEPRPQRNDEKLNTHKHIENGWMASGSPCGSYVWK